MVKRKIIKIDEIKCNGCGSCIPNCPEGAIQIIDGKARIVSDLFCDGLGACLGQCPKSAISIEERQAQGYEERRVMENIVKQGENVIRTHLVHLREHNQRDYLKQALDFLKEKNIEFPEEGTLRGHGVSGCPGSQIMNLRTAGPGKPEAKSAVSAESQLRYWPVQLMLVSPAAAYLNDADILIAADCVPFAYASFHQDFLKDKVLLVGCPKLDNTEIYQEKMEQILEHHRIKSITYVHMEVPCCFGLINVIHQAISQSSQNVPFKEVTISIKGERL